MVFQPVSKPAGRPLDHDAFMDRVVGETAPIAAKKAENAIA